MQGAPLVRAAGGGGDLDQALAAAERISRVMDGLYLDPLLGFFLPGAGDILGAGMGLYPVVLAWRRGAPKVLLARMLLNLSVDLVSGAVPILGDIWDFFFRAHRKNLTLLRQRAQQDPAGQLTSAPGDGLVVAGAGAAFLAALAVPVFVLWKLVGLLIG